MKLLILLLFPLISFGQWEYKKVLDSKGKDSLAIATNKNLSMIKTSKGLSFLLSVDENTHIRSGNMTIDLTFITDDETKANSSCVTIGTCSKDIVTLTNSLHTQHYIKELKLASKIEIRLNVNTDVRYLTYSFDSKNFSEAYNFIIQH